MFSVLAAYVDIGLGPSPSRVSDMTGLSRDRVMSVVEEASHLGFLSDGLLTHAGMIALDPYRVENAIIMAAGMSRRFAPISYEKPKGALMVRGEMLIERQIRQLKAAGVDDITVVVGYKREYFAHLDAKFGVRIVENPEYATRNNNSTLWTVRDRLANTYICSSDDYFTENPFTRYVYRPYYAAQYADGSTDEWCMTGDPQGRIIRVSVGGQDSWFMMGHAYFDRSFSKSFVGILESEYNLPETAPKLWEEIYKDHLDELAMFIREYPSGVINEFDSLDELRGFDPMFIQNVDCSILDNITQILACERGDISDIVPINQGLTNLSFVFTVGGRRYVYRHPGEGTGEIISRESEAFSQSVALDLGLDHTFIHEDAVNGWKISYYRENTAPFDYHNKDHVQQAMQLLRTLHTAGKQSRWDVDLWKNTVQILSLLHDRDRANTYNLNALFKLMSRLHTALENDSVPACLCHVDFYDPNLLVSDGGMDLIDWEYSGMSDFAVDLGTFICCSDYTFEEAMQVIEMYFERTPTAQERAHVIGYIALASFYWLVWGLRQESEHQSVGEYLELWHTYAWRYGRVASDLYEKAVR